MALIFQSNPDQWDLRKYMEPGNFVSWFVSRYQSSMYPGALVLLWEAKGKKAHEVRGLYGWGITTDEVKKDKNGRFRIRLQYIERWISKYDAQKPLAEHNAPIPASDVLQLPSWRDQHLLALMPIGTNFLVTVRQLEELSEEIVQVKFPISQFPRAVKMDTKGEQLDPTTFTLKKVYEDGE